MTKDSDVIADKWQWREFCEVYMGHTSSQTQMMALKHMDNWLSDKTYLVGTEATSVDADVFRVIHPALARLSHQEREAYPHLCRWFRLVQSSSPAQRGCPPLVISRTQLYS